jgi:hypothetical protein
MGSSNNTHQAGLRSLHQTIGVLEPLCSIRKVNSFRKHVDGISVGYPPVGTGELSDLSCNEVAEVRKDRGIR